jgi:hypothetical protein
MWTSHYILQNEKCTLNKNNQPSLQTCKIASVIVEVMWDSPAESWGTKAGQQEATLYCAQTQWTQVQRLSPENKGVSPYIPLQAGYRSKKQNLTHIWLHATLLATSPSHTRLSS